MWGVFWWSNVVGSEVTCGELMWWFATRDVMWCDVISCCPVLTQHYEVLRSTTPYYKVLRQYYSVLQRTTPVLQSTTPYYKVPIQYYSVLQSTTQYYKVLLPYYSVLQSTTLYYKVLLQYYKVLLQYYKVLQSITPCTTKYYSQYLRSTTPILLCTTKYYSSTTPYYKVLRQYYSVLQSTTPVLQSTTPHYKSTTKLLLQYYTVLLRTTKYYAGTTKVLQSSTLYYKLNYASTNSVLQSTTPVLQSTTPSSAPATKSDTWASPNIAPVKQNDSHAWSWSHMKRHLQCAEQQVSPSNLTKYRPCHTEWLACLIVVTYETSFTMRGATGVTIQPHQILRLPHRKTRMLDRRHIWNVIYNARSNRCHHPTSPNTAPATQNDSHAWSPSHMKRHLQCGG